MVSAEFGGERRGAVEWLAAAPCCCQTLFLVRQRSRSFARAKALAQDDNVWWLAGKKRREKGLGNSCQRAAEAGQQVLAQ